jgi:hypothetical protein
MRYLKNALAGCLVGGVLLGSAVMAQAADAPVAQGQYQEAPVNAVTGSFTVYGWAAWMSGDTGVNGIGPVSVSLTPKQIIDALDGIFMGTGDIRWGKFGLFGDLVYLKMTGTRATPGPLFSSASLTMASTIATAAGTYQLWENGADWIQGVVGARFWSFDTTLSLGAGILAARSASDDIQWVDPVVGLRGRTDISDKTFLTGAALIGGFGAGSEFMWDIFAGVGYRVSDSVVLSAGYRAFGVDYSDKGDVVDLISQGPVMGLSIVF